MAPWSTALDIQNASGSFSVRLPSEATPPAPAWVIRTPVTQPLSPLVIQLEICPKTYNGIMGTKEWDKGVGQRVGHSASSTASKHTRGHLTEGAQDSPWRPDRKTLFFAISGGSIWTHSCWTAADTDESHEVGDGTEAVWAQVMWGRTLRG